MEAGKVGPESKQRDLFPMNSPFGTKLGKTTFKKFYDLFQVVTVVFKGMGGILLFVFEVIQEFLDLGFHALISSRDL